MDHVLKGKAGVYAQSPEKVLEVLCHLLLEDGKRLSEMAENAKTLGRPNAAYEIAELVMEAAHHGPYTRSNRFPLGVNKIKELLNSFGILAE